MENRILGAFYGQMLGDAMGMPSELWPRSRVKAHFGWIDRFLSGPAENNAACYFARAKFTDDTSMALALADAIIEHSWRDQPGRHRSPYPGVGRRVRCV
ncbi:ADP-ribosyl-[dinitrogen reductase] hydrolase [Cedecea neteri]|uniref:ADP-ribosyl-[dinitrogen reductase] hydrolase n=1 Tax=Cedecea neteri TaxID=158822 RepID=A0A2X3J5M4_9ENTR|nr:ADP-ribosyl-[dinitrogen reductase] hydrolase [Cedecea neteri]